MAFVPDHRSSHLRCTRGNRPSLDRQPHTALAARCTAFCMHPISTRQASEADSHSSAERRRCARRWHGSSTSSARARKKLSPTARGSSRGGTSTHCRTTRRVCFDFFATAACRHHRRRRRRRRRRSHPSPYSINSARARFPDSRTRSCTSEVSSQPSAGTPKTTICSPSTTTTAVLPRCGTAALQVPQTSSRAPCAIRCCHTSFASDRRYCTTLSRTFHRHASRSLVCHAAAWCSAPANSSSRSRARTTAV
mmetsp:Transcript_7703/g.20205  ORF Transcript_7703/g.20205 Transcript_7703/m.20205 type:complete len:251 (-) Transcript_7703:973-1725(-)